LSLVKLPREFLLGEQLGDAASRCHVAGEQRGQRRHVQVFGVSGAGDLLPILVDYENRNRVRVALQPIADRLDLLLLLLEHHYLGATHPVSLLTCGAVDTLLVQSSLVIKLRVEFQPTTGVRIVRPCRAMSSGGTFPSSSGGDLTVPLVAAQLRRGSPPSAR